MTSTTTSFHGPPSSARIISVDTAAAITAAAHVPGTTVPSSRGEDTTSRSVVATSAASAQTPKDSCDLPVGLAGVVLPDAAGPHHERRDSEHDGEPADRRDDASVDAREAGERGGTADERDAAHLENVFLRGAETASEYRCDRHERGDREENRRPQPEEAANAHSAETSSATTARAFSRMNSSVSSYASSSTICCGRDFMRYELGPTSAPRTLGLRPSFASRTASITIPAEFGESQTSSLSSTLSGTSPNDEPSIRM